MVGRYAPSSGDDFAFVCVFAVSVPSRGEGAVIGATPISANDATAPFVARGYRLLRDRSSNTPKWIVATYGIYPATTNFVTSLATLRVYKNVYWAKRHAAVTATSRFRYPGAYRVRNVALYVEVIGHPERRQRLVSALRSLGIPLRLY
jgi:hypothetical protein